jgi:hypothetical protein
MPNHTPGPWVDDTYSIIGADDSLVAECGPYSNNHEEADANARLIASAPDLLAACKALADAAWDEMSHTATPNYVKCCERARAAIRAAEGNDDVPIA